MLAAIAALLVLVLAVLPEELPVSAPETMPESAGDETDEASEESTVSQRDPTVAESVATEQYPGEESVPEIEDDDLFPTVRAGASPGTIYLVLDDAGYSLTDVEPFLEFPGPLTIAVLPQLRYSAEVAELAVGAGKEVIVHMPLEPLGGADPGPGAILTSMSDAMIWELVEQNINSVPGAIGVNNHMGSKATSDERVMELVIGEIERKGMFFLDSRTSAQTVGASVAARLGVPHDQRDVFLDNQTDTESLRAALRLSFERSLSDGEVVVIGHVTTPGLAELLIDLYDEILEHGYRFGALSSAVGRRAEGSG